MRLWCFTNFGLSSLIIEIGPSKNLFFLTVYWRLPVNAVLWGQFHYLQRAHYWQLSAGPWLMGGPRGRRLLQVVLFCLFLVRHSGYPLGAEVTTNSITRVTRWHSSLMKVLSLSAGRHVSVSEHQCLAPSLTAFGGSDVWFCKYFQWFIETCKHTCKYM